VGDIVCCPLNNDGDGTIEGHTSVVRCARKEHRCYECSETIANGDRYEYVSGIWDRAPFVHKTCLSCVEIRTHFACGSGWIYGEVWAQLEENFFPDMKAGGPCMTGLSPAAKSRLFERRLKWLEDTSS
jgi:hypothetical protein